MALVATVNEVGSRIGAFVPFGLGRQRQVHVGDEALNRICRFEVSDSALLEVYDHVKQLVFEYIVISVGSGHRGLQFVHATDDLFKNKLRRFSHIFCHSCDDCDAIPLAHQRPFVLYRHKTDLYRGGQLGESQNISPEVVEVAFPRTVAQYN